MSATGPGVRFAWRSPGVVVSLTTRDGRMFPAVRLDRHGVAFFRSAGHPGLVVRLLTRSGEQVYVSKLDRGPGGAALEELARGLEAGLKPSTERGGVVVPMLVREGEPGGAPGLALNEHGCNVESGAGPAPRAPAGRSPPPDHALDRPFLLWVTLPGSPAPSFVAHVATRDWKSPGSGG